MDWCCAPPQHDTFLLLHEPPFTDVGHLSQVNVLPTILRTCFAGWHRLQHRRLRSRLGTNETSGIQAETMSLCEKSAQLPETATTPSWNPRIPWWGLAFPRRGMGPPQRSSKLSARWNSVCKRQSVLPKHSSSPQLQRRATPRLASPHAHEQSECLLPKAVPLS